MSEPARAREPMFADAMNLFASTDEADRPEALAAAAGLWLGYPLAGEVIEARFDHDGDSDARWTDRQNLEHAHFHAVEFLRKEAERVGLNSAPLSESRRVCQELFRPIRGASSGGGFGVEWFHHPACTSYLWPECLGEWRYGLPPAMQEAIRSGEEIFMRLTVIHGIEPAAQQGFPPHEEPGLMPVAEILKRTPPLVKRSTLYRWIELGKIASCFDEQGRKAVSLSELGRRIALGAKSSR